MGRWTCAHQRFAVAAALLAIVSPLPSLAGPCTEGDCDGIPDVIDKCSDDSRNAAAPCDSDTDGYGTPAIPTSTRITR